MPEPVVESWVTVHFHDGVARPYPKANVKMENGGVRITATNGAWVWMPAWQIDAVSSGKQEGQTYAG